MTSLNYVHIIYIENKNLDDNPVYSIYIMEKSDTLVIYTHRPL